MYPPEHHVLRDLAFEIEAVDPRRARAHLTVTPEMCDAGGLAAGPVMTVIDVLSGSLVGRVVAPDWMATAQLTLHLDRPPAQGPVVADAEVVREGRTTVVVEVGLRTAGVPPGGGEAFGEAMLTFVRLPRRDTNFDLSGVEVAYGERSSFALPGSRLAGRFDDEVGVTVLEPATGSVRVPVDPYILNSFGAVNGGVVASIAASAARALAGELAGAPVRATDVVVHYLTQGRVGPLATAAEVLRQDAAGVLARVEVADTGQDDQGRPRAMVIAHVQCAGGT